MVPLQATAAVAEARRTLLSEIQNRQHTGQAGRTADRERRDLWGHAEGRAERLAGALLLLRDGTLAVAACDGHIYQGELRLSTASAAASQGSKGLSAQQLLEQVAGVALHAFGPGTNPEHGVVFEGTRMQLLYVDPPSDDPLRVFATTTGRIVSAEQLVAAGAFAEWQTEQIRTDTTQTTLELRMSSNTTLVRRAMNALHLGDTGAAGDSVDSGQFITVRRAAQLLDTLARDSRAPAATMEALAAGLTIESYGAMRPPAGAPTPLSAASAFDVVERMLEAIGGEALDKLIMSVADELAGESDAERADLASARVRAWFAAAEHSSAVPAVTRQYPSPLPAATQQPGAGGTQAQQAAVALLSTPTAQAHAALPLSGAFSPGAPMPLGLPPGPFPGPFPPAPVATRTVPATALPPPPAPPQAALCTHGCIATPSEGGRVSVPAHTPLPTPSPRPVSREPAELQRARQAIAQSALATTAPAAGQTAPPLVATAPAAVLGEARAAGASGEIDWQVCRSHSAPAERGGGVGMLPPPWGAPPPIGLPPLATLAPGGGDAHVDALAAQIAQLQGLVTQFIGGGGAGSPARPGLSPAAPQGPTSADADDAAVWTFPRFVPPEARGMPPAQVAQQLATRPDAVPQFVRAVAQLAGKKPEDLLEEFVPLTSDSAAQAAAADVMSILREASRTHKLGPTYSDATAEAAAAFEAAMFQPPADWAQARQKVQRLMREATAQRAYRARMGIALPSAAPGGQGGQGGGAVASSTKGYAVHLPSTKRTGASVAADVLLQLADPHLIMAEAGGARESEPVQEARRLVTTYGQPGWAAMFHGDGMHGPRLPGEGISIAFARTHSALLKHAAALCTRIVGRNRVEAGVEAEVTEVAAALVSLHLTKGATREDGQAPTYPLVGLITKLLGGEQCTDEFPMVEAAYVTGRWGAVASPEDVKRAFGHVENVLLELHADGGRARVAPAAGGATLARGAAAVVTDRALDRSITTPLVSTTSETSFGLEDLLASSGKAVSHERTISLLGTVLARWDRAAREARTEITPGLAACPVDLLADVEWVRTRGLPAHRDQQRLEAGVSQAFRKKDQEIDALIDKKVEKRVTARLAAEHKRASPGTAKPADAPPSQAKRTRFATDGGVSATIDDATIARAKAEAEKAKVEAEKAATATKRKATADARAAAQALEAELAGGKYSSPTKAARGAGAAVSITWPADATAGNNPQITAVRLMEDHLDGTSLETACPWYGLFLKCYKANNGRCDKCNGGVLLTAEKVGLLKAAAPQKFRAKITGPPTVKNPAVDAPAAQDDPG